AAAGRARPPPTRPGPADTPVPTAAQLPWLGGTEEELKDAMERRRLLQWAAAGLGASALDLSAESTRQLLDRALAAGHRTVEDWELTGADHLYALRTQPPAEVRDDLAMDLRGLLRQVGQGTAGGERAELRRVTAMLAMLHANVLTRLGEHGTAIRWWRTARHAA